MERIIYELMNGNHEIVNQFEKAKQIWTQFIEEHVDYFDELQSNVSEEVIEEAKKDFGNYIRLYFELEIARGFLGKQITVLSGLCFYYNENNFTEKNMLRTKRIYELMKPGYAPMEITSYSRVIAMYLGIE